MSAVIIDDAALQDAKLQEVDEALAADVRSGAENDNTAKVRGRMQRLSSILRTIAVMLLVGAAGIFLFQGWLQNDSIKRVLSFLGFSLVLGGAGMFCGLALKDDKGARTGLSLATLLATVVFSQVGALIYSLTNTLPTHFPNLFRLSAISSLQTFSVLAAATAVLLPIAYLTFSALARSQARVLTSALAIGCTALLIPTRDADIIGLLIIALASGYSALEVFKLTKDSRMRNIEGKIARGIVVTPLVIITMRSLALYDINAFLMSSLLASVGAYLFFTVKHYQIPSHVIPVTERLGTILMSFAYFNYVNSAFYRSEYLFFGINREYYIPLVGLPVALIVGLLSLFTASEGKGYRSMAVFIAITTAFFYLVAVGGIGASLLLVLFSIVTILCAFLNEEKVLLYAGAGGFTIGLFYHLRYALTLYTLSPWLSIGLLGIGILIGSSYVEKNFARIMHRVKKFRAEIEDWK